MNRENNTALHSRYNPQGEADRYINSLSLNEKIRFFILIEPGLGYMVAPLRKKVPGAKVIVLHAEKPACPQVETPDSEWYPETGISVQNFLEAEIPDSQALELRLLEWRPALAVYGKKYLSLVEETTAFIKRSDANARTIMAFGPKWFKNFFKNLDIIREVICPVSGNVFSVSLPILVTGSGPGLENAISIIKKPDKNESPRQRMFILAAASSQTALKAQDLFPNMAISTDGSNWAKFHLYDFFRDKDNTETCPIAVSLIAALPSQSETIPVLVISDGCLWQTLILQELKIPFIVLPQRGTVTATALDLAFTLTKEEILIAGMDLANRDIRSHVRPYSFDRFMEEKEQRMNPVYSQTYKRSSALRSGGSFGVYASWFEKQLANYPRNIHTLGDNNPVFGSFETLSLDDRLKTTQKRDQKPYMSFKTITLNFSERPSRKAYAVLEKALKDPAHGEAIQKELISLLLPGKKTASAGDPPNDLIDTIRSLIGCRFKENDGYKQFI